MSKEVRGWDVFQDPPVKLSSGSMANQKCMEVSARISKVIVYLVVFMIVLCCSVVAKGSLLLMTSQLRAKREINYCNPQNPNAKILVTLPEEERIMWMWCIMIVFAVPQFGTFIRSVRMCIFKSWRKPSAKHFQLVFIMETLHVIGLALMFFAVLPQIDAVKGAMLANCVCFMPGFLNLMSRNLTKDHRTNFKLKLVDMAALVAQTSAFFLWPFVDYTDYRLWLIPVSLLFISCGWWENYVSIHSPYGFIRILSDVKKDLRSTRYFTYMFMSVWKILVFFNASLFILFIKDQSISNLFSMMDLSFQDRSMTLNVLQGTPEIIQANVNSTIYILLLQIFGAYLAYIFGKFACKILIQGFSFALPVSLTGPVLIAYLTWVCERRNEDSCYYHDIIPDYLFFESPSDRDFLGKFIWIWFLWLFSQLWITRHIWQPHCERLAATEKLFVVPMYDSLLIDQSLGLNRKRDDQLEMTVADLESIGRESVVDDDNDSETISQSNKTDSSLSQQSSIAKNSDHVTRIYTCATMWHETKEEMIEFLKSIFRLDEDQCARRVAQKYLKVVDPDYYEIETHIFFDDAFEIADHDENEIQVNRFVKLLVETVDEAASEIHQTTIHVPSPKKTATPYGGRLVWTLPGKTKMTAHLKDKNRIRHRKRWSQVMYMYYLLGFRLMDQPISVDRKETIAENTYLLALDGDVDFQPLAVMLLVDLMKKNQNLGAACGRIHPVGSGPIVWYQLFEYAIGHWLQKATEHMIGCVLCSPGCFSLFRGKALMDDNVMKTYTRTSVESRDYVQYDQGEDRWLCTLLLQRGYRVEYCAASDAYTHAPESFNEFYNQRRRWAPSTMANIMDLLANASKTIKVNDNISRPYIAYQMLLMGGTIIGPGTIFLMLVGSVVAVFRIANWTSFFYNVVPIVFFTLVCIFCNSKIQLLCAGVLSTLYAMLMMAVIIGTAIQITEDGISSPLALFLIVLTLSFIIAAILHPQEFYCIMSGLIYLLLVPSMYLLLIIYSIVNLNVVTWGTREVQVKKTKKELDEEKKEEEEARKKAKQKTLLGFLRNQARGNDNDQGSLEFSFAGLFKCLFCIHGKPSDEKQQLIAIAESLEQLGKRIKNIERAIDPNSGRREDSSCSKTSEYLPVITEQPENQFEESNDTESEDDNSNSCCEKSTDPYWLNDPALKDGKIDALFPEEEQFWMELLKKYLFPIDEDKAEKAKIANDLMELRNRSVFIFYFLNALFVLAIFLAQLHKSQLHIRWTLGRNTSISNNSTLKVGDETDDGYLKIEPIGLMLVSLYSVILVIQFFAMLFHRLGTFAHILASTTLDWFWCKPKDQSGEAWLSKHAVEIVRDMQRLVGMEGTGKKSRGRSPGKRKTVRNLEKNRQQSHSITNLDSAFRRRFFNMSGKNNLTRNISTRGSLKGLQAFEERRKNFLAENQLPQSMPKNERNTPQSSSEN